MSYKNSQNSLTGRILKLRNESIPKNYFNKRKPIVFVLPDLVSRKETWLKDLAKEFRIKKQADRSKKSRLNKPDQRLHTQSRSLIGEQILPFLKQMNFIRRKSCEGEFFGHQSEKTQRINQLCPQSFISQIRHIQITQQLEKRRKALKLKTLVKFQNQITTSVSQQVIRIPQELSRKSSQEKTQKAKQQELSKFAQNSIPPREIDNKQQSQIHEKDKRIPNIRNTILKTRTNKIKQETKDKSNQDEMSKSSKKNECHRSCPIISKRILSSLQPTKAALPRSGRLSIKNLEWKINLILHTRCIRKATQPSLDDFMIRYQDYEQQESEYVDDSHIRRPVYGKTSIVDSDDDSLSFISNSGKNNREHYKQILRNTKTTLTIIKTQGKLRINKTMSNFIEKQPISVLRTSELQSPKEGSVFASQQIKRTFISSFQTKSQQNISNQYFFKNDRNLSRYPTIELFKTPKNVRKFWDQSGEGQKPCSIQMTRTKTSPGRQLLPKKSAYE